jgi:hypothetical protein
MREGHSLRRLRRGASALVAIAAVFGFAGRDLAAHAHGFDEVDLVGHAIAAPVFPHELAAHQPLHIEASRAGAHVACIDCILQALARDLTAASPSLTEPHGRSTAPFTTRPALHLAASFEAASPRGPPSAA